MGTGHLARNTRGMRSCRTSPFWWWCLAAQVALLPQGGAAQAAQGEVVLSTHPPHIFSPNPPACAENVAKVVRDATEVASRIVQETTLCAEGLGWSPQFDEPGFPNWHEPQRCADSITFTLAFAARFFADFFSASFNCLNINQACAQSVSEIVRAMLESIESIIQATRFCEPPGVPPNYWNNDIPAQGIDCWWRVWHSIERIMKAAKFIDVAVSVCPTMPLGDGAEASAGAAAADAAGNSIDGNATNSDRNLTLENSTDEALLRGSAAGDAWLRIQQPEPWSMGADGMRPPEVDAVERRLQSAAIVV